MQIVAFNVPKAYIVEYANNGVDDCVFLRDGMCWIQHWNAVHALISKVGNSSVQLPMRNGNAHTKVRWIGDLVFTLEYLQVELTFFYEPIENAQRKTKFQLF